MQDYYPCWVDIRAVISNHIDRQNSRYILGGRRSTDVWEYYYNLDDLPSVKNVISEIKNGTMNIPDGIERVYFESSTHTWKTKRPFYIKLKETNGSIAIHFHAICGYELIRSYNKKLAIRLLNEERALLKIVLSKKDQTIWGQGKGNSYPIYFSWWINRLMVDNKTFRLFFIDLLYAMGKKNSIYIDVAKSIEADHYCLVDIPLWEVGKYKNKNDLIRQIISSEIEMEYERYNLNYLFAVGRIAESVDKKDFQLIQKIDPETISKWINFDTYCIGSGSIIAVEKFYEKFFREISNSSREVYCTYVNRERENHKQRQNYSTSSTIDNYALNEEESGELAEKLEGLLGVPISIED